MDNPTPVKLLRELGIEKEDVAILLINGRDGEYDQNLNENDYISVFPPVGGG
jgi:molybdopterin converting factor small subunit